MQDGKCFNEFRGNGHGGTDGDGGDDGSHEGFKNIRAHSRDITHIVAHVIGDDARVSGIIFGNARFHFTHQVGAHIRSLGVHAAAHTSEKRDGAGTHGKAIDIFGGGRISTIYPEPDAHA